MNKKRSSVPFSRSYWVVPGKLMAGYYPGSEDKEEAFQKLKGLLSCGIRHVINLMEENERNWAGKPFVPYVEELVTIAETMGVSVTVQRIPIKDGGVPTRAEMIRILDEIDHCIKKGQAVYVHCWGGRGRTGTVIGCHLARHGLASREEVLRHLQELRKDTRDHEHPSPETGAQIEMVRSWREGR